MALLPADEVLERVRRLCAEERRPLPDIPGLADELEEARQRGYMVARSFQPGRTSVAAAIADPSGHPVGGVDSPPSTNRRRPNEMPTWPR
jgi:DNA-binding IclR family transcriptional regulator